MILWQTIWGTLEKNIRLGFRKGCVIPEWFALLLIKQKNYNKIFGEFEFEFLEVRMARTSYMAQEDKDNNFHQNLLFPQQLQDMLKESKYNFKLYI